MQASLELEALADGHDFYPTISRSKFESLNTEYWKLCIEPVQKVSFNWIFDFLPSVSNHTFAVLRAPDRSGAVGL
jgi:hypothetical protein